MGFGMSNTSPWVVIVESIKVKWYGLCPVEFQEWFIGYACVVGSPAGSGPPNTAVF